MEERKIIVPTKEQIEWADCEIGALIHVDLQIFDPEYHNLLNQGKLSPASVFNPDKLDTDQWVKAAKDGGAKYVVLVAKHCSGFTLWPTKATPYSVKNSPYQNGMGDVVKDFLESCKKYDMKPGFYYSTGCNYYCTQNKINGEAYNNIVQTQLRELWSYGKLFEIWFDGGCVPVSQGGPDVPSLIRELQPDAVAFQMPKDLPNGLRWIGNESGYSATPDCWATIAPSDDAFDGCTEIMRPGDPWGASWRPAEADVPGRRRGAFEGGWFYRDNEENHVFSSEELFNKYVDSVGRNCNLLLGMVINQHGLYPKEDYDAFVGLNEIIKRELGTPLDEYKGDMNADTVTLKADKDAKYLVICENIAMGERILGYNVITDKGEKLEGKCIGHKRILRLPEGTKEVTFTVTEKKAELYLKSIALY